MFGEQATADWQSTLARQKHAASRVMQASLPMITQSCSHMFGVYKRKARYVSTKMQEAAYNSHHEPGY